jgi:hypothetical protein
MKEALMRKRAAPCSTFAALLTIVFVIGSATNIDAQQTAIAFKGFPLGGSMASFKERFPDFKCEGGSCRFDLVRDCMAIGSQGRRPEESSKAFMACTERNSYGGIRPKAISAKFVDDALASVMVVFVTKLFFDDLGSAMISGFGQPTRRISEPVQNRMGATFENEKLIWTLGGITAVLSKYGTTLEEGSVYITSDKHVKDIEKEQQEQRQKGARDL